MKNISLLVVSILLSASSYAQKDTLNAPKASLPDVYANPHITLLARNSIFIPRPMVLKVGEPPVLPAGLPMIW